jgi:hypothetical protein
MHKQQLSHLLRLRIHQHLVQEFHHYLVVFLVLVQHLIYNYPVHQVFQVLVLVFHQEC